MFPSVVPTTVRIVGANYLDVLPLCLNLKVEPECHLERKANMSGSPRETQEPLKSLMKGKIQVTPSKVKPALHSY